MDNGARLSIKFMSYGEPPRVKLIEGQSIPAITQAGEAFLNDIRRKYE